MIDLNVVKFTELSGFAFPVTRSNRLILSD